jgi:methyltransferase (TIGR00027 family)
MTITDYPVQRGLSHSSRQPLSYTACNVIACLIAMNKHPRFSFLVSDEDADFYKTCLAHAGNSSLYIRIFAPFPQLSAKLVELFSAKCMACDLAIRKFYISCLIEGAYREGVRQLIILGGGFDIGAFRMASQHQDLQVFEIDRLFMHSLKTAALQDSYGRIPPNFTPIVADLATARLKNVLESAPRFDCHKPSVFVAEGVIFFLKEDNAVDLVRQIRTMAPPGSRFIFTAVMTGQNKVRSGLKRRIFDLFLSSYGEIIDFQIDPENMMNFLNNHGFKMCPVTEHELLRGINGQQAIAGTRTGEYVVSAVVA